VRVLRGEPAGAPVGTAVVLHGFTRSPHDLGVLAARCEELGARSLRPALGSLWWPSSTTNSRHLDVVVERLAPMCADGPVAVIGHSAGGAAGAWIAAGLAGIGLSVRGLVLVDAVESPTGLIRRAWPRLAGIRVRAACAPPSRCNRDGALAAWLGEQRGDVAVVEVPGSGHGDIEDAAGAVYRWACGDDPARPAAPRLLGLTVDWAAEALTPGR
jgi:pimeloyl-ACP methyl ester carboxylesterase